MGNGGNISARRHCRFCQNDEHGIVLPGAALWALGALTFLFAAVLSFNPRYIWRKSIPEKRENKKCRQMESFNQPASRQRR